MKRENKKNPTEDLQLRGSDGVLYRIPAAELLQYAISEEKAYKLRKCRSNYSIDVGGLSLNAGPKGSIVVMPPSMYFRLVRFAMDLNLIQTFVDILKSSKHEISIPINVIESIRKLCGGKITLSGNKFVKFGDCYRIKLLEFGLLLKDSINAKKFDQVLKIMKNLDYEFYLTIPTEISNEIKLTIYRIKKSTKLLKASSSSDKFGPIILSCGCGGKGPSTDSYSSP